MTVVLSRSADHLYWIARQVERAENAARILDASYRMALLPAGEGVDDVSGSEWDAVLRITGDSVDFLLDTSALHVFDRKTETSLVGQ